MLDLTFLNKEQIFGDNRLKIFDKCGTNCAITDFTILLGGYVTDKIYVSDIQTMDNRTGRWNSRTLDGEGLVFVVAPTSKYGYDSSLCRYNGIRPATIYSSMKDAIIRKSVTVKEVEYGEYPQWVVNEEYSKKLEDIYNSGNMEATGKIYTTDSSNINYYRDNFSARTHKEYEYDGRKYIRFVGDINGDGEFLSDGRTIKTGLVYWISVEPIIWLVDEKNDIALSKYIIVSGIQFDYHKEANPIFENNQIKNFMDTYLAKEIECINTNTLEEQSSDIDEIFEEALFRINEIIRDNPKTKILK